ncbi:MAG: reverse transcriptase N-terminal domain-containing protein [Gammaproteobacteria bacterium]|nr:reverse transcriptase N-terminal domain-containing protein [Gammaproteobacteria bacterium]
MDASSQCDVVSDVWRNWNSVNWAEVHRTTWRLQTRITKAVRDGDWRGAGRRATKIKRMKMIIDMLARGEKFH